MTSIHKPGNIDIWAVYRCKKLKRGEVPSREAFISAHESASKAMDKANELAKADKLHSYTVGLES